MKTALVTGATGLIGSILVEQLITDPTYTHIRILTRHSTRLSHPKVEEQVIDFDKLSSYSDLFRANDVFCCLGTTLQRAGSPEARRKVDHDLVVAIAQAAEGKAEQFIVVSSVGADAQAKNAYLRDKGQMEAAVSAMKFKAVILMQPSFFYGNRKENRIGERIGIALARLVNPLLGKYKAIPAEKIARAMRVIANRSLKGVYKVGVKDILANQ